MSQPFDVNHGFGEDSMQNDSWRESVREMHSFSVSRYLDLGCRVLFEGVVQS